MIKEESVTANDRTDVYSVSQICAAMSDVVSKRWPKNIWVEGEIEKISEGKKEQLYITLLEPNRRIRNGYPDAQLRVVLWSTDRWNVESKLESHGSLYLEKGLKVCINGKLNFWESGGIFQFEMWDIDPNFTLGQIEAERRKLKKTVETENLAEYQKLLSFPVAPYRVGLVTSKDSAAHNDFMKQLELSGYSWDCKLFSTTVQGVDAPAQIVSAINKAVSSGVEVVAVVRGGGSGTDLAAFDSELVVRCVAKAQVPVIVGVGHETDTGIVDMVAHKRLSTPTDCANYLVTAVRKTLNRVAHDWNDISINATSVMSDASSGLDRTAQSVASVLRNLIKTSETNLSQLQRDIAKPAREALIARNTKLTKFVSNFQLDDIAKLLARDKDIIDKSILAIKNSAVLLMEKEKLFVDKQSEIVKAGDTTHLLEQYGLSVTRVGNKVVRSLADVKPGSMLTTQLASGETLRSVVPQKKKNKRSKKKRFRH